MAKASAPGWTEQRPFPCQKPSQAQCVEDDFMAAHGGAGPRLIYLIVEIVAQTAYIRLRPNSLRRRRPAYRATCRPR